MLEIPGVRSLESIQTPTDTSRAAEEELGRTAFLELMIAQISNQNPLEPAKNEAFVAQLAQFSSLEGIQNMNESMESLVASLRSSAAVDAASLVGRNVLVPTGQTALNTAGGIAGMISLDQPADALNVEISNAAGQVVYRGEYGAQSEGEFRFSWDGTTASGQPAEQGFYQVRAYAEAGGNGPLIVSLPDQVVSVTIEQGGLVANLAGGGSVPSTQIREIQ